MNYPITQFEVWNLAWEERLISMEIAIYLQAKILVSSPASLLSNLLLYLNHGQVLGSCVRLVSDKLATYSVGAITKQWVRVPSLPVTETPNLLENIGVNFNQQILLEMLRLNPNKRTYFNVSATIPQGVTTADFHSALAYWQYRAPVYNNSGSLQTAERGFWNLSYGSLAVAWAAPLERNLTQSELVSLRARSLIDLPGYLFFIGRLVGQSSPITFTAIQQVWQISPLEAARAVVSLGNTDSGLSPDFWEGVVVTWTNFLQLSVEEYNRTKSMYRAHGLFLQQLRVENTTASPTQGIDLTYYQQKYYPVQNPVNYELRLVRSTLISHLCKLHELGLISFSYSSFRLVST